MIETLKKIFNKSGDIISDRFTRVPFKHDGIIKKLPETYFIYNFQLNVDAPWHTAYFGGTHQTVAQIIVFLYNDKIVHHHGKPFIADSYLVSEMVDGYEDTDWELLIQGSPVKDIDLR